MYLARLKKNGHDNFVIRKSYYDEETKSYSFKPVFDLGAHPGKYIELIDERVVCFEESLESAVASELGKDPTLLLEQLLWDFLSRKEKEMISLFTRRPKYTIGAITTKEKAEIDRSIHLMDRRRMYYIRYGAVDQARIYRLNDKIYRPLLNKSRDEKEYYFKEQEKVLEPSELKTYIYVIFNLQQHFQENFANFMPEALDQEKIETHFMELICNLNADRSFWQGESTQTFLHNHLQRYIIWFFDFEYAERSFSAEYFRSFRESHRQFNWPERKTVLSEEETGSIFNQKIDILKKMTKQELARSFRQRAKDLHPDGGGEHEDFIKLLDAYDALKKQLKN